MRKWQQSTSTCPRSIAVNYRKLERTVKWSVAYFRSLLYLLKADWDASRKVDVYV